MRPPTATFVVAAAVLAVALAVAQGPLLPNSNPTFLRGPNIVVLEDSGVYHAPWATNISDGEPEPGQQSLQFVLTVLSGNSLFSSVPRIDDTGLLTFTAAPDQFGSAQIAVYLQDDGTSTCVISPQTPNCPGSCVPEDCSRSTTVTFTITILPVNDCPRFSHLGDQTALEDAGTVVASGWARSISMGAPNEAHQRLTWTVENNNPTLFSTQPTIDWSSGSTTADLRFRSAPNAFGSASVTVQTRDDGGTANGGCDTSTAATFTITITPVNDHPSFAMGPSPVTVAEDFGPFTFSSWATQLNPGAPGEEDQSLMFDLQLLNSAHSAIFTTQPSIDSNGNLRFESAPNANTHGIVLELFVRLRDSGGTANGGVDRSCDPIESCNRLRIVITPVNDAPHFTPGDNVEVWEDLFNVPIPPSPAAFTAAGWATAISPGNDHERDVEGQTVSFRVSNSNPAVFSVQPAVNVAGQLSFTLAPDRNGAVSVTVTIVDSLDMQGTSHTLLVRVLSVNDAPTMTLPSTAVSVDEDAPSQSLAAFATAIAPGPPTAIDEVTQLLTFMTTASMPAAFSTQPRLTMTSSDTAALTFHTTPNYFGDIGVTAVLRDDGGTARRGVDNVTRSFVISIAPVNDPPTFNIATTSVVVVEDQFSLTPFSRADFVWDVSAGPMEDDTQSVSFTVSTSNPDLFSSAPQIVSRALTFRTAPNAFGEAILTITATDTGEPVLSTSKIVTLRILAKNDPPTFTIGHDLTGTTLRECRESSACPHSFPAWATNISPGPPNEAWQAVWFTVDAAAHAALFQDMPSVSSTGGTLSFSLRPFRHTGSSGPLTLSVTLHDNGGTLNGGVDSTTKTFRIEVPPRVDPPGFTIGWPTHESLENQGTVVVSRFLTQITAGSMTSTTDDLRFTLSPTDAEFFATAPSITLDSPDSATLKYRVAAHRNGPIAVTIVVENTATDMRSTAQFTISVAAVNSQPTFTLSGDVEVLRGSGQHRVRVVTHADPGPGEEHQTYTFSVTCTVVTALFRTSPSIDPEGDLRFELTDTGTGGTACSVVMRDSGGTARGGIDTSEVKTFTIRVLSVNNPPTFVGGTDVTVLEDSGSIVRARWATDLSIGFGDSPAEQQLSRFDVTCSPSTLFGSQPKLSVVSGDLSFSTARDEFGNGHCSATLHDTGPGAPPPNRNTSQPFEFTIVLLPVNDPPFFIGGGNVVVLEDSARFNEPWASEISAGPPNEAHQQLHFETTVVTNAALFLSRPNVSAADGVLSFELARDMNGVGTVRACLVDDGGTSNGGVDRFCREFTISVTPVNDPPTFQLTTSVVLSNEDAGPQRVDRFVTEVSPGPPNEAYQTVTLAIVFANESRAHCETLLVGIPSIVDSSGALSYESAPNEFGECDLFLIATDSEGASASAAFSIKVRHVNDPPTISLRQDVKVLQGNSTQTIAAWADTTPGPLNEAHQHVTVVVTAREPDLFALLPSVEPISGNLTFRLHPHVAGFIRLSAVAVDDGGIENGGIDTSPPADARIEVLMINTAPSFELMNAVARTLEDSGHNLMPRFATSISAGEPWEAHQVLEFVCVTDSPELFALVPSISPNGTLSFAPDDNRFGTARVTVHLRDDGGTMNGGRDRSHDVHFVVNITGVNDPPTFTIGNPSPVVREDDELHVSRWATNISPGPFEDYQTVTFSGFAEGATAGALSEVSVNHTHFVAAPAPNYNGPLAVSILAVDNGGTDNGGIDRLKKTIEVYVIPVNDPPIIELGPNIVVEQDSGAATVRGWITRLEPGPPNEAHQQVAVSFTVGDPSLFVALPSLKNATGGDITFKVAPGRHGRTTITVRARDDGGTAEGGNDTTIVHRELVVTRRTQRPSFTPLFSYLRVTTGSVMSLRFASNITDDVLVSFQMQVDDALQVLQDQPTVTPGGMLMFTTSASATGVARLFIRATDGTGTTSAPPSEVNITVVQPTLLSITLAQATDVFSPLAFREQIAVLFQVHVDRVVIVSSRAGSVVVLFFISGLDPPPITAEQFVARAADATDVMHERLPIESVHIVGKVTEPPPTPTAAIPGTPPSVSPNATAEPAPEGRVNWFSGRMLLVGAVVVVVFLTVVAALTLAICRARGKKSTSKRPDKEDGDSVPPRDWSIRRAPPTTRPLVIDHPPMVSAVHAPAWTHYGGGKFGGDPDEDDDDDDGPWNARSRGDPAAVGGEVTEAYQWGSDPFASEDPDDADRPVKHHRSWVRPQDVMFAPAKL